ncbi:putative sulfatase [Escherichia coli]|nr:putative sulfatase [Escherichia coli]
MVTHRQRYREKVSQMVSWGHWFALFNILLSLVIGSRYLFIADWPTTLAGRIYSYVSIIGHFSFLVFRHLLADPLPADLYRRLPEADEVFVRHSGNGGNDAITDR